MYNCKRLETDEITLIYKRYMKKDFPRNELRPLIMIKKSLSLGQYDCFGIFDENALCGYAFFASITQNGKKYYLLDYFATLSKKRGQGIGSEFIKLLRQELSSAEMVICEVENPEFAVADEQKKRLRRIEFYKRNGFINTNVKANVFGVDFLLLELNINNPHKEENVKTAYYELYKKLIPRCLFNRNIRLI